MVMLPFANLACVSIQKVTFCYCVSNFLGFLIFPMRESGKIMNCAKSQIVFEKSQFLQFRSLYCQTTKRISSVFQLYRPILSSYPSGFSCSIALWLSLSSEAQSSNSRFSSKPTKQSLNVPINRVQLHDSTFSIRLCGGHCVL